MAEFKEELVINALHTDKAEVGKKYWFADDIVELKKLVETNGSLCWKLEYIHRDNAFVFLDSYEVPFAYYLIYPYEEPPKQRMTNRQFVEWCNKGNGQWKWKDVTQCHVDYSYSETIDNKEVDEDIHIRLWGSEEWIDPTVDIYERAFKKEVEP